VNRDKLACRRLGTIANGQFFVLQAGGRHDQGHDLSFMVGQQESGILAATTLL
jgi:hypothetical protein